MTSKSINYKPFLLKPVLKDYLWGGRRLKDDYAKPDTGDILAESWECSVHPDGESIIGSGEFEGLTLSQVLRDNPNMLGDESDGQLNILIKLIDADKDLSVQVHPDDEYAKYHENGQMGKTEMWYVLDADKDSKIAYGFHHDTNEKSIRKGVSDGTITNQIQYVNAKKDDVFFVTPGTVHAIGKGILVAEVQECSNLTYRLYDYERVDKNGNKRELHLDKAIDVINMKKSAAPRQPMRVLSFKQGYATELLGRCKYFSVERMLLNTQRHREMARFSTDNTSFQIFLVLDGCGIMMFGEEMMNFFKGDCIFVPAHSDEIKLHGNATLLKVKG